MDKILKAQTNEMTEHRIYSNLARLTKGENSKVLEEISADELKHHDYWKSVTNKTVKPKVFVVWFYTFISYVFGLSFGLRLMERGEQVAQEAYKQLTKGFEKGKEIISDEQKHEKKLLGMLKEEKLEYASSIVLGLNDALVELTGALAGLTLALQDGKLIGIIGLITGIAASMSMAASGYLSSKEEDGSKKPLKSATYTGITYIFTVLILVGPFFLIKEVFVSLAVMLGIALFIIFLYTYYITVAKGLKFWRRFLEMAMISITVAAISFLLGYVIKTVFGISV